MKSRYLTIMIISVVWACTPGIRDGDELTGSWSNIDLHVNINQANPTDSSYSFVVPEESWEQILNIKPIVTEFRNDGTYHSQYHNLKDSLVRETRGEWQIDGDTLELSEDGQITRYYLEISGNQVTFRGWLDWDQDGETDDLYIGRQRKIGD